MKKVLISQKDLHATKSGVPRIVHQQLRYFSAKGHQAHAIAERIDKKAVKASGGIPIKTFRWPISGYHRRINYQNRVIKAANKLQPDLIIGHGDIVNQDICYIHNCVHLAYEKIHGKKIPLAHEVGRVHETILRAQIFNALICNSQMMKTDLIERFRVPETKVEVLYPMYSSEKFHLGAGAREQKRKELNVSNDEVLVGFITSGNFKKRNLKLLIEAVAQIRQNTPLNFKVLVAGKDKIEPYQLLLQKLELEESFIFAPSIGSVEDYYAASDIFVLPAHIEEFGLSIMEAMACGRPVVTTDMTGASELIELDSKNFILREKTVDELAFKLKPLIEDQLLRDKLGKLNSETAKKHSDKAREKDFALMLTKFGYQF